MVGFVSPQPNPECFLGLLMFEFWVPFICLYKIQDQADQPDILHIPNINAIKNKEFLYHPTSGKDLKTRDNLSVGFTSCKTGVGTAPAEEDLTQNLV
jgi:hypothetical protein